MRSFLTFAAATAATASASGLCGDFASKPTLDYAGATITYHTLGNNEEIARIVSTTGELYEYVLTKCDSATSQAKTDYPSATVVKVPVMSVTAHSAPTLSFLDELDVEHMIVAYSGHNNVVSTEVRSNFTANSVPDTYDSSSYSTNWTAMAAADPEVHFASNGYGGYSAAIGVSGLPADQHDRVVMIDEVTEKTPLGRAEWIKVVGLITGKEERADQTFKTIKSSYEQAKLIANSVLAGDKPKTVHASFFSGSMYAAASDSYMAELLRDAGGDYIVPDTYTQGSTMPLSDLETILADAEVYFNSGTRAVTIDALIASADILKTASAAKCDNMYEWAKRYVDAGGYDALDFFEGAIVKPHLSLQDAIAALHPDLMTNYETYFTTKLTTSSQDLGGCPFDAEENEEEENENEESSSTSSGGGKKKKKNDDNDDDEPMVSPSAQVAAMAEDTIITLVVCLSVGVLLIGAAAGAIGYYRGRRTQAQAAESSSFKNIAVAQRT